MQIQQSRSVCPDAEEKSVAEIHLARKTGKKIPTRREDGEDARLNQDAKHIRVFGKERQQKQEQEEEHHDDPAGKHQDFISHDGIKLSQVKGEQTHDHLSSSKETPKRPSGLMSSTRIMTDRATDPFRNAPLGIRKTTSASAKPRM